MRRGRLLQEVVAYFWSAEQVEIPALRYWDGTVKEVDGRKWIIVQPPYDECRCPDVEILSCGHERVIKGNRKVKWFSRRRVCRLCALGLPTAETAQP